MPSTDLSAFPPLVNCIANALLEKKADDIRILDVSSLSSFTNYFVICSANSDVHAKAISGHVLEDSKKLLQERTFGKEGFETNKWIVLDYFDVVVHIFIPETRDFYALERMWNDAKVTTVQDT
jgi:ribosome-associated protein